LEGVYVLDRFLAVENEAKKGAHQVLYLWGWDNVDDTSLNVLRAEIDQLCGKRVAEACAEHD
jgi:hypothetical protein